MIGVRRAISLFTRARKASPAHAEAAIKAAGRAPISAGDIPAHPVGVTQKQQLGFKNQIHGNPRTSAPLPQRRAARGLIKP